MSRRSCCFFASDRVWVQGYGLNVFVFTAVVFSASQIGVSSGDVDSGIIGAALSERL